jgi:hypothetical protein
MHEVSPDGAVIPYGAHGGWNATAGSRIMLMELMAAKTGDGEYRYVAHKLMNYLLYQQDRYFRHHILAGPMTTEQLALAYLFADESIEPVEPDSGSRITYRSRCHHLRLRGHSHGYVRVGRHRELRGIPDHAHSAIRIRQKPVPRHAAGRTV